MAGLGGLGWKEVAILAASLIALAIFLFLVFLILCLLCPAGLCCGPESLCCARDKHPSKKKASKSSSQALELSLFGRQLKLPRVWMDNSKSAENVGLDQNHRNKSSLWTTANDDNVAHFGKANQSSSAFNHRSATSGAFTRGSAVGEAEDVKGWEERVNWMNLRRRSIEGETLRDRSRRQAGRSSWDDTWLGESSSWGRYIKSKKSEDVGLQPYRGSLRDLESVGKVKTLFTHHLDDKPTESAYQTKAAEAEERERLLLSSSLSSTADFKWKTAEDRPMTIRTHQVKTNEEGQDMSASSNLSLMKKVDSRRSEQAVITAGVPVVQCYTVTNKTTTTTYGDEEGDEETSVVTTTEKKWREGMNEIGEISVSASATAGELLPSIGAPTSVLADVSNARTVKSLTTLVTAGSQNRHMVRNSEYQQSSQTAFGN